MTKRIKNPSPGNVLLHEFLAPLAHIPMERIANIKAVSNKSGLSLNIIFSIILEEQPITPEIAQCLAKGLGTSPELWLNLQRMYDEEQQSKRLVE